MERQYLNVFGLPPHRVTSGLACLLMGRFLVSTELAASGGDVRPTVFMAGWCRLSSRYGRRAYLGVAGVVFRSLERCYDDPSDISDDVRRFLIAPTYERQW